MILLRERPEDNDLRKCLGLFPRLLLSENSKLMCLWSEITDNSLTIGKFYGSHQHLPP